MYSFLSHIIYVSVGSKIVLSHRWIVDYYMSMLNFISSTIDGHLECFRFLNMMSILAHVFWYTDVSFLLGLAEEVRFPAMQPVRWGFASYHLAVSQSGCTSLRSPQQCLQGQLLHNLTNIQYQ